MAYKAPASPGTEHEGNWYVPVIGMAGGLSQGMGHLRSTWADTLRLLSGRQSLPTTENIINLAGGMNISGRANEGVRAAIKVQDAVDYVMKNPTLGKEGLTQSEIDAMKAFELYRSEGIQAASAAAGDFGRMVGKTRTGGLLRPGVENAGGMVPDKDVMDRVMNSGLRNEILGFGTQHRP